MRGVVSSTYDTHPSTAANKKLSYAVSISLWAVCGGVLYHHWRGTVYSKFRLGIQRLIVSAKVLGYGGGVRTEDHWQSKDTKPGAGTLPLCIAGVSSSPIRSRKGLFRFRTLNLLGSQQPTTQWLLLKQRNKK